MMFLSGRFKAQIRGLLLIAAVWVAGCASPQPQGNVQADVQNAQAALQTAFGDPRMASLREDMRHARAALIVPSGATRGVTIARDDTLGHWAGPAFYQVLKVDAGGGSWGFRVGEPNVGLIALAMTDRAVQWLMQPTFPKRSGLLVMSGTDPAARTSGGTGREPDMVLYDLNGNRMPKLDGILISIDSNANATYFQGPVSPQDILRNQGVSNPAANSLLNTAEQ
jgi:lipid-binding SYLF domain-containing protein